MKKAFSSRLLTLAFSIEAHNQWLVLLHFCYQYFLSISHLLPLKKKIETVQNITDSLV